MHMIEACVGVTQVLDNGRRLHLGDAADATKQAFSGFAKNLSSAFMVSFQGLQNAFKTTPGAFPEDAQRQPVRVERQPEGTSMEASSLPAGARVRVTVRSVGNEQQASPMESRMAGPLSSAMS